MTLVVARCNKGRLAIAADTRVSAQDVALPITAGTLKSCCLPGYLCVSFAGSPEAAAEAFWDFSEKHPQGSTFDVVTRYFENSSARTGCDYILAFGSTGKLVTIRDGKRIQSVSNTHWIGDKLAFEKFREYERRQRERYEHGRAINAAIFADEMEGSPASELQGIMRNIILDPSATSVGGFVTVISNRDIGFRFSTYSDILLDWPANLPTSQQLQLTDKFDLSASGENDRYSVSQISPGYYNLNIVAFYLLKGKLLYVLYGSADGLPGRCAVFSNVEPNSIAATLDEKLGFDFRALCLVMSSRQEYPLVHGRPGTDYGISMSLFCECNTMPIPQHSA